MDNRLSLALFLVIVSIGASTASTSHPQETQDQISAVDQAWHASLIAPMAFMALTIAMFLAMIYKRSRSAALMIERTDIHKSRHTPRNG